MRPADLIARGWRRIGANCPLSLARFLGRGVRIVNPISPPKTPGAPLGSSLSKPHIGRRSGYRQMPARLAKGACGFRGEEQMTGGDAGLRLWAGAGALIAAAVLSAVLILLLRPLLRR